MIFFFKQKTAYEMRISDWSSDVCSSDLEIAVLQTGNTSLGVTLLATLVREAAARLGPDWDIEIVEMHHRYKVDAPSGTALLLGEAAAAGRGEALPDVSVIDRKSTRLNSSH